MPEFEPIVGRYLQISVQGIPYRIYFEEAGSGIPLVCLHTAGSDGRQYRHILTDRGITRNYRVLAFDLPWYGKSNPPVGFQNQEYRLTTQLYTDTIMAFCRTMGLDKPVVMGCSMGGRIVLDLALRHGDELRAVIGLEGADHQQPWYDTAWLHRPDVHGGEVCAAFVSGNMAPHMPHKSLLGPI